MSYACPACSSENTQKLSILFGSGTADTSTGTVGIAVSGGRAAVGVASTTGTSQSVLAQRYAPPEKQEAKAGCFIALGAVAALCTAVFSGVDALGLAVGALFLLLAFAVTKSASKYNRDVYPDKYLNWSRQFVCLRCSNVFTPTPRSASSITIGSDAEKASLPNMVDIVLHLTGDRKLAVTKEVMNCSGIGIRDASELIKRLPTTVRSGVSVAEAEIICAKFRSVGAVVDTIPTSR